MAGNASAASRRDGTPDAAPFHQFSALPGLLPDKAATGGTPLRRPRV